jgi:hypothetical protein
MIINNARGANVGARDDDNPPVIIIFIYYTWEPTNPGRQKAKELILTAPG